MTINEKAAYLQGIIDGMKLDLSTPENKLISQVVSIISDIAEVIEDIKEETENLGAIVDELDTALEGIEELVYDDEDEIYDIENEINCPKCGFAVIFDDIDDPSDIVCENCGEHINLEDDEETNLNDQI